MNEKIKNNNNKDTIIDRAINYIAPTWAAKRLQSRLIMSLAGAYHGASKSRRQLENFNPKLGDADSDTLDDLESLRNRSRDLLRNTPIATGAVLTNCVHVVGDGLKMQSEIDRSVLSLTEEQADQWQTRTELEFKTWSESMNCSYDRTQNFYDLQTLVLRSSLESGDCFVALPFKKLNTNSYGLKIQVIEADRICNPDNMRDTENMIAGIMKKDDGEIDGYWIKSIHPGSATNRYDNKWQYVKAFTNSGRRNILHIYERLRPNQSRGVPYLAPVIEHLHQLGKYTKAELTAAVVSSMFTVFLKTQTGNMGFSPFEPVSESAGSTSDKDYRLGSGAIVELARDEDVSFANPSRPNTSFDQFVQAVLRQIGVALGIPFELLIMHFTKSYSAARAAMLNAYKMFLTKRGWLVSHFCYPVYEAFLEEAILRGRIIAPGFFEDEIIRKAYSGVIWIGQPQGQIDPQKEIGAAEKRINLTLSSRAEETAALTGTDWDKKIERIKQEKLKLKDAGINGTNTTSMINRLNQTEQAEQEEQEEQEDDEKEVEKEND